MVKKEKQNMDSDFDWGELPLLIMAALPVGIIFIGIIGFLLFVLLQVTQAIVTLLWSVMLFRILLVIAVAVAILFSIGCWQKYR